MNHAFEINPQFEKTTDVKTDHDSDVRIESSSSKSSNLPNSVSALVLGILSIVFSSGALIGLILGIIGLSNANKGLRLVGSNKNAYEASSVSQARAGKVCSIIGIVFSSLILVYWILVIVAISSVNY